MASQFSPKVSEILAFSREEAARLASRSVGPEHLMLGLLRERNSIVSDILSQANVDMQSVKHDLEMQVRENDFTQPINTQELVLNTQASNILKLAVLEARMQSTNTVEEQHLLLAILHDQTNNGAKTILESNSISYEDVLLYIQQTAGKTSSGLSMPDEDEDDLEDPMLNNHQTNGHQSTTARKAPKSSTPVLDNFGTDLTQAAAEGKLDPVVGREREIERVTEILGRRKKNNPVLIGEPGVGKSAIVEGLAQLIVKKRTSPILFNKRLINLDMTSIVAGTK